MHPALLWPVFPPVATSEVFDVSCSVHIGVILVEFSSCKCIATKVRVNALSKYNR